MADADANNDEGGDDATVDGDSAAKSSVAQRGDRPQNNCERGGNGINASEGLIDLKNGGNHDLPVAGGGRNVADHVLQDVRDDESADRRGDYDGDARETASDDCSEGDPVGGGQAPRQPACAQKQQQHTHHGQRVRGTGDDRQMRDLLRSQRSRSGRVDSHCDDAAQRTGNECNSSFTIIRHDRHSRQKSLVCESVFAESAAIRDKGGTFVQE